jgi:hypothetical protein
MTVSVGIIRSGVPVAEAVVVTVRFTVAGVTQLQVRLGDFRPHRATQCSD